MNRQLEGITAWIIGSVIGVLMPDHFAKADQMVVCVGIYTMFVLLYFAIIKNVKERV